MLAAMDLAGAQQRALEGAHPELQSPDSPTQRVGEDVTANLRTVRSLPQTARRVLAEVEKSRSRPFPKVLFALGIRHVGARGAELLAEAFGSLARLRAASLEEITGVKGVGAKIGHSVYETLRHPPYVAFMDKVERANVNLVMPTGVE